MSKSKQSKQVKQAKRAQHTHAMGKPPKGHADARRASGGNKAGASPGKMQAVDKGKAEGAKPTSTLQYVVFPQIPAPFFLAYELVQYMDRHEDPKSLLDRYVHTGCYVKRRIDNLNGARRWVWLVDIVGVIELVAGLDTPVAWQLLDEINKAFATPGALQTVFRAAFGQKEA